MSTFLIPEHLLLFPGSFQVFAVLLGPSKQIHANVL